MSDQNKLTKTVSIAGVLIALGIVFGDIGTSPLYTMNALTRSLPITESLIIGGVSCIIWTLTLQTTLKYVMLTLNADNNGEGGIFSLYALVRKHAKWLVYIAMIGGAMLLADGLITPPITVSSAIEGLELRHDVTILIILTIITLVFFLQQFGTHKIGKLFGPIMLIWFTTILSTGLLHVSDNYRILEAFNPVYAIEFLKNFPNAFWLLSAIFLCTTGGEALYSDLGHCGKKNIRVAWIYVKICLIANYLGQGAYALHHYRGKVMPKGTNLFFDLFPEDYKIFGIVLATLAAVIACQALISGSFTLVSEGIKLNLLPKLRIKYPSTERGQLYIPKVNTMLWIGCLIVVLYFQESKEMEGAYGLAINFTVIITTILLSAFLYYKKVSKLLIVLFLLTFMTIEISFLIANLSKFEKGGYVTVIVGSIIMISMYVWYRARKIKNSFVEFIKIDDYIPIIRSISEDTAIPKYATHLVYLTSANNKRSIEQKIIHSILKNRPKRADMYWLIHVDVRDVPYLREYEVTSIEKDKIYRIDFRLGFRESQRVHFMFKKVLEDMLEMDNVDVLSRYPSLREEQIRGDFEFIVMEKFLSYDVNLKFIDTLTMQGYFLLKHLSLPEDKAFGLNINNVTIEKVPLDTDGIKDIRLVRKNGHI